MVTMDEIETNKYSTVEKLVKLDYLEQVIERKINKIKESKSYSMCGYFKPGVKKLENEKKKTEEPVVIDLYQEPGTENYSLKPRNTSEREFGNPVENKPRKKVKS